MAAPGIQLNSQIQLTYFQPTVDQYVEKIKQAVASQDKTAAEQALEQLEKAVPGAGQTGGNGSASGASGKVTTALQYVRSAIEGSDFPTAGLAVTALVKDLADTRVGNPGLNNTGGTAPTSGPSLGEDHDGGQDGNQYGEQDEQASSGNVDVSV